MNKITLSSYELYTCIKNLIYLLAFKELEDRLYGALDSAMQEAYNRNGQTRPDLWLVYAHKDLTAKVNPRPSWRSLINMLNSTEMVLNIAQR